MSQGSVEAFKENWKRPEADYCHFTRGEPENQIQFAFRENWKVFRSLLNSMLPWDGRRSLEVGAGRGTMSMYLADAGWDCFLLDACEEPLNKAANVFASHGLSTTTITGDCEAIPLGDRSVDLVFSYGLLEHFEDPWKAVEEQFRVLKYGGIFIAYVVPAKWTTPSRYLDALAGYQGKQTVYRSERRASSYVDTLEGVGLKNVGAFGLYPVPMLGAGGFPFTLNSPQEESAIVGQFKKAIEVDGWTCDLDLGQAFIVSGRKTGA